MMQLGHEAGDHRNFLRREGLHNATGNEVLDEPNRFDTVRLGFQIAVRPWRMTTIEPLEGPVLDQPRPPVMSAAFGDFKLLDDVAVLCDENGAPGFFGLSVLEDLPGRPRG